MARRNSDFIGTYAPKAVKEYLQQRAKKNYQTVSQVILEIIIKEIQEEQQNRFQSKQKKAV